MSVYLKYNEASGNITDANDILVACFTGFKGVEVDENKNTSIDDMIKLKNSGFTAEEVIAIKKANL